MSTVTQLIPRPRRDSQATPDIGADDREQPTREVVVGVDGSITALAAVRWAAGEAAARAARLRIVHAARYLRTPVSPRVAGPELPRARRIAAVAFTVAKRAAPPTPVVTDIVAEEPLTALLRAGRAGQLLVVGSSTTGAVDELVLASLTQQLARRSSWPVVAVPRSGPQDTGGRPVVAVLDGDEGDPIAAFAVAAARRAGRPLLLLDTRQGGSPATDRWSARFRDVPVQHLSMPHASAVHLLDTACPTPLLVVPARKSKMFRSLHGPARSLLRRCTCPVALLPEAWAAADSAGR